MALAAVRGASRQRCCDGRLSRRQSLLSAWRRSRLQEALPGLVGGNQQLPVNLPMVGMNQLATAAVVLPPGLQGVFASAVARSALLATMISAAAS